MAKKTKVKFLFEPGNSEVTGSHRCQEIRQDKGILTPQENDKKPVSNLRLRLKPGNQKLGQKLLLGKLLPGNPSQIKKIGRKRTEKLAIDKGNTSASLNRLEIN